MKTNRRFSKITYTKKALKWILIVALIDMQLPFVLAFLGRDQIAEDLGKVIVVEIIGVFLTYCLKSFFETKEEEKTRLKEMQIDTLDSEVEAIDE